MPIGSWIGQPYVGHVLVPLVHHLIRAHLSTMGFTGFRVHCHWRMFRPTNTGVTHYARAAKLTCVIMQKVTS